MHHKILVAYDGTKSAEQAFETALDMARRGAAMRACMSSPWPVRWRSKPTSCTIDCAPSARLTSNLCSSAVLRLTLTCKSRCPRAYRRGRSQALPGASAPT